MAKRGGAVQRHWRSIRTAAWLGWQVESNWTDPFLFAVYSIAKPLALAGILVAMYAAVTQGDLSGPRFANLYVGTCFYLYVGGIMSGMAYAVIDDRERYRMLRAIYVAPIDFRAYLIGRGAARFVSATLSVAVSLALGVWLLQVRFDAHGVDWIVFAAAMIAGIAMLALLGLMLASLTLLMTQMAWSIGDAAAGTLYIVSSAAFPLDVLPVWLRTIGLALPFTYWLELVRRSLLGSTEHASPLLATWSSAEILGVLLVQIAVLTPLAFVTFRIADHFARERGLIDRWTNY